MNQYSAVDNLDNLADALDYDYSTNEVVIADMDAFRQHLLSPFRDKSRRIFYRGERIVSLKRPLLSTMFRDRGVLFADGAPFTDIDAAFLLNYYRSNGVYLDLFRSTFGEARKYRMYELCAFSQHYLNWSPFIDFSKSLYVAISFGLKGKREFTDDALIYTVEVPDETYYTSDRVTAECWLNDFHVRIYDAKQNPDHLRKVERTSPEARIIDIATNDRMKFQRGVFLLLDKFNLVNRLYLTKNVRSSVSITKYILDKEFCPELTALVEEEAPWYDFSNLLDISAGIQTAINHHRVTL